MSTAGPLVPRSLARLLLIAVLITPAATTLAQESGVRASYGGTETSWVTATTPIEIQLTRQPAPSEGRLAVMIGQTDWSALVERVDDTHVAVRPVAPLLSSGEQQIVVYLVSPQNLWSEVGRFVIRVLTPKGFESAGVQPAVELSNKGQLAYARTPAVPAMPRDRFQDFNVTAGLQAQAVRSGWTTDTQVNVLGTSRQDERLRFGSEGADAPAIDLAGYSVTTASSRVRLGLGLVTVSGQRYLGQLSPSRGIQAFLRLGPVVDLSVAAVNGSTIVGWSNPFGLNNRNHQVRTATLGLELQPSRPGAARVAATLLDGSLLPTSGYTQGVVNDAEHSRGGGLQFTVKDPQQRVHVDAGFARTRFENPVDPLLARGRALVPVRASTRDAKYADLSVDVVRGAPLGATQQASLTAGYRYEQVDPLFRSVGLPVRADVLQHVAEAQAQLGPVAAQAGYTWLHDNVGHLASVLTTRSRTLAVNIAATPASLRPSLGRRAEWIPIVTYSLNRMRQLGDGVPVNAGFDSLSQVPDQANTIHTVGVEWQQVRWRAAYRLNRSAQDNRQPGRELADFVALNHTISVGVTPRPSADVGVDVGIDGTDNREEHRIDVTRRLTLFGNWRPTIRTTVMVTASRTRLSDTFSTGERTTSDFSMQLSQSLPLARGNRQAPGALLFIRATRQSLFAFQPFGLAMDTSATWTVNSGVTVRVF